MPLLRYLTPGGSSALRIFLWTRAVIWAAAVYAWLWFLPRPPTNPPNAIDFGAITDVWAHWDAGWFIGIAQNGYSSPTNGQPAFYPLYPSTVGAVARVIGGHYVVAGIVVSLACCLASFVLLHRLAERHLGSETASRAVLYLAISPMALFLQAVYSESLFLLACLAAFDFAERRRWLPAGLAAGLALLTRLSGFALLPALLLLAWRSPDRRRALPSLLAAPIVFSAFPLWLHFATGDAWAFTHADSAWNRHLASLGPLTGLWQGLRAGWDGFLQLVTGTVSHSLWPGGVGSDPLHGAAHNLENLAFLAVFAALSVLAWRRLGPAYGLFALTSLLIPLAAPSSRWPLLSLPRFCLVIFPAYIVLGSLGKRPAVDRCIIGVSAIGLGIAIVQWSLWQWVS